MNKNMGTTFIEILIVIAIISLISSIVFMNLSGFRDEQSLNNTSVDIVSLLNKARQNTLSSINSNNYGVHFESNMMTLFIGPTYSSSDPNNEQVLFSPNIIISLPSGLNIGGGSDVIFERLTGETTGGTITIQLVTDSTKHKIITINKTGVISSN